VRERERESVCVGVCVCSCVRVLLCVWTNVENSWANAVSDGNMQFFYSMGMYLSLSMGNLSEIFISE